MSREREGWHGIHLSWLQIFGVLLVIAGAVLWVYTRTSQVNTRNLPLIAVVYDYVSFAGTPVLITVGVFIIVIGEFRKH